MLRQKYDWVAVTRSGKFACTQRWRNNEARLSFSSRDKSVSSNLGESVMSKLEMPKDDKTGKRTVIHFQLRQQEPS